MRIVINPHVRLVSGSINSALNLGSGTEVYTQNIGGELQFRTLVAGSGIDLTNTVNEITITNNQSGSVPETRTINGYTLDDNITLTKSDLNLEEVDNTSDLDKPLSSASIQALELKLDKNELITPGTFNNLIVDSKGLVTSGSVIQYLKLDQSSAQTLTGGAPRYETNRSIFSDSRSLVDKEYSDDGAVSNNIRLYLLQSSSSISSYRSLTFNSTELGEEQSITTSPLPDGLYEVGNWITTLSQTPLRLLKGTYELHIHARKVSGGRDLRVLWRMYEYKEDTSEILILSSNPNVNTISTSTSLHIQITLPNDYVMSSGSLLSLKLLSNVSGLPGTDPVLQIYFEHTADSHWKIPGDLELVKSLLPPSTGSSVSSFLDLSDTPSSYTPDYDLKVNSSGSMIELVEGKLYSPRTVTFNSSMSSPEIQTLIDSQPRNLNSYSLTFQLDDGTYNFGNNLLNISGFYNGYTFISGNTSENHLQLHTNQAVIFNIDINSSTSFLTAQGLRGLVLRNIRFNISSGSFSGNVLQCGINQFNTVQGCYFNRGDSLGSSIFSHSNTGNLIQFNYFTGGDRGIFMFQGANATVVDNSSIFPYPQYGVYNSSSIIYRAGVQPSGSIANSAATLGGQFFE